MAFDINKVPNWSEDKNCQLDNSCNGYCYIDEKPAWAEISDNANTHYWHLLSIKALAQAVPVEARAFLGAVAAFVVFLFVLFLYLNKKLCFYTAGSFPCCDDNPPTKLTKDLGAAFNYDFKDSSSDSENDATKKLTSSKNYTQSMKDQQLYSKQNGYQNYQSCQHSYHQLGPSRSTSQFSNREFTKTVSPEDSPVEPPNQTRDLISLAEKGRAGVDEMSGNVIISSSSASSSGSTTSGDDDLLTHRNLRHRDPRSYRHMSPSRSPYQGNYVHQGNIMGISEEALLTKCGSLEAGFAYDMPTRTLTVHILQAKDVPVRERGGPPNTQVRLLLFPIRKQKQKTKIRTGENPHFNEAFVFTKINPEDLNQLGIRLRLCGCERMKRERIIGEIIMPLSSANMTMGNNVWLTLEPRAATMLQHVEERAEVNSITRSESSESSHSTHGGLPELLLGLTYKGTTGRLAVEVIKGSHFRQMDDFRNLNNSRPPDTYVKLTLTSSSGQEIASSKTSVKRGQPSPLFKETFIFQVALFQLPDVTLLVSVYAKRSIKRKDVIGWFALGLNSSGDEELAHWNEMRESRGEQISRWHVLLEDT